MGKTVGLLCVKMAYAMRIWNKNNMPPAAFIPDILDIGLRRRRRDPVLPLPPDAPLCGSEDETPFRVIRRGNLVGRWNNRAGVAE